MNPLEPDVNVDPTTTKMLVPTLEDMRRLTWFAAASYCPATFLAKWDCRFCRKVDHKIEFLAELVHSKMETSGYVALDHTSKKIIITYRGTNNSANRVTNLKINTVPFRAVPKKNVQVHTGFLESATSLLPQTKKMIKEIKNNPKTKNYKYMFTGHSLGGAMAVLVAIQLKNDLGIKWSDITIVTYGQPRTGNIPFAQWFNRQPVAVARVVNANDPVPHLLGGQTRYFAHHQHEIFLDPSYKRGQKTPRLCSDKILEDPSCSNRIGAALYESDAHSIYFDADYRIPC
ncbi:hypothetical protein DSO57_1003300 [Entomophthora muscae]|uniref:Uncharacterized protein n=1 Tax=Entomophthora muscae TaxID=34485 RepID=A0ACC2T8A6_9FUNG|nr:hypothetical protein DSO57_1003300 [Entomophthora muscae]